LSGIDLTTGGAKQGRNLRGKLVPVTETATSVNIAFQAAASPLDNWQTLNSIAAANTGGATLADATYYYTQSIVRINGETLATPSSTQSVTVSGANNSVVIGFSGGPSETPWRRRIYRASVDPTTNGYLFDGYFDHTLNSSSNFTDIGQAFTSGTGKFYLPNITGAGGEFDPSHSIEPDANYAVIVTPSWSTTAYVTSRATTGFTINFGTAAPAGATVDWLIVR
jgi:hypothetical protein